MGWIGIFGSRRQPHCLVIWLSSWYLTVWIPGYLTIDPTFWRCDFAAERSKWQDNRSWGEVTSGSSPFYYTCIILVLRDLITGRALSLLSFSLLSPLFALRLSQTFCPLFFSSFVIILLFYFIYSEIFFFIFFISSFSPCPEVGPWRQSPLIFSYSLLSG